MIQTCGGVVDKFIGDAIMATWGGLSPLVPQNADFALQACLQMREKLELLNLTLKNDYGVELKMGMGLNYGEAVVGTLGSDERMEFTSIGDAVNMAARVESLTKEFSCDFLVTQEFLNYLGQSEGFTFVTEQSLRGKKQSTKLFTFKPTKIQQQVS
ncbi:MAG: adenylate/guanylate cyclase domain-containing protein [Pseudobdellovibrionaceae bacterium]